jgi:hypothetical protein
MRTGRVLPDIDRVDGAGASAASLGRVDEALHQRTNVLGPRWHEAHLLAVSEIDADPVLADSIGSFLVSWVDNDVLQLDEPLLGKRRSGFRVAQQVRETLGAPAGRTHACRGGRL